MEKTPKLELIHYILNNRTFSKEVLFDDSSDIIFHFSYRQYDDDDFVLIGYSYRNSAGIYEYINLNFDFLLKTSDKILNEIAFHLSKYNPN